MNAFRKISLLVILCLAFSIAPTCRTNAQILEIINAVINAIDVKVQQAQNKIIDLQNAEKELENTLSQTELGDIAGWLQKQKDLYSEYFDELWQVKNVISYFKEITDIVNAQKQLITEYKAAYSAIQQDKHFSPDELNYCYSVYSGIIDASTSSVDEILTILKSFSVQMSDAERLKIIKKATVEIQQQISDLRRFNNENIQLSLSRAKDQADIDFLKKLYGLPN